MRQLDVIADNRAWRVSIKIFRFVFGGIKNMFSSDNIERISTIYGIFYSLRNDLITNQLKQFSAHTRNELAMIKSLIKSGDNIIDIGAHIGTFSIPFARFNEGKGKIFSFEADRDNYNLLKRNISENCLDGIIIPMNAIVYDSKKRFRKLTPCNDNSGMYSFVPESDNLDATDSCVINIDEWYEQNGRNTRIDFLKIDVEGAEVAVLTSCDRIIEKYRPPIYIELNKTALDRFGSAYEDIEGILNTFGYHFFRNTGPRNSDNDVYMITRLVKLQDGGDFYDLLAIHPSDSRYHAFA